MIKAWVDSKPYSLFTQFDLVRSLDTWSGDCQIVVSEAYNAEPIIKINSLVEIQLDNQFFVLFGYAEDYDDSLDSTTHDVSYKIRDNVQDLIDSTIPDNFLDKTNPHFVGSKLYINYVDLLNDVISGLGIGADIEVIDQKGLKFPGGKVVAAQYGQKAGDFLLDYGRLCHAILSTDGFGNIIILNLGGTKLKTPIVNMNNKNGFNNNVIDSHIKIDYSGRYNKYVIRSSGGIQINESDQWGATGSYSLPYFFGTAYDPEIRTSRVLEIMMEGLGKNQSCQDRAQEEANLRRARSIEYTVTIAGFSSNGELWDIGKLVSVYDDERQVFGLMLIKEVKYHQGNDGELTTLTLCPPDAYGITATLNDDNILTITDKYVTSAAPTAKLKNSRKVLSTTLSQSTGAKK